MELFFNQFKTAVSRFVQVTVVFCCLLVIFSSSAPAHAQSQADLNSETRQGLQVVEKPLGLPSSDIRLIIASVIRTALGLLGIIFLVLVIYAGYLWMTAAGNDEQIISAKKILRNAAVGLAIILLAYSIVSYIMYILGVNGAGGNNNGVGNIGEQNFVGSGALGHVIKDHYPARNQVDVPRNTKIIITFFKPINTSTIATDSNLNGNFADCTNIGPNMDWDLHCDKLIMDNAHINITRTDNNTPLQNGAAVIAANENGKYYTLVIRPIDPLGSPTEKVEYTVHVGKSILVDDKQNQNISVFAGQTAGNDYYEWKFTVDTKLDVSPPHVVSVSPENGETAPKNTAIQIKFSEAVDPTGVQGVFTAGNNFYVLEGSNVYLQTGASTIPLGTMRSVDGYRMLEFTPSTECGTNACGGKVYCLPVCDANGANCQVDTYHWLLKAAKTFSNQTFEAIPLSGIMDVSGNALDGNNDSRVDTAPNGNPFPDMVHPDNFDWQFRVENKLDLVPPYITKVTPGIDAQFVKADDPMSVSFSKPMLYGPLYSIRIAESPASNVPICYVPRSGSGPGFTVELMHCPFLDTVKHYYIPTLDSSLLDTHFNCLYPGKGPLGLDGNNSSLVCDGQNNCCSVDAQYGGNATCCNGTPVKDDTGNTCAASLK